VRKDAALATFLQKDDQIAADKDFFIEPIRKIKEELVTLKKEHPDLPWAGEQDPSEER